MNKTRIVTLADGIESVRPDWSHTGIVNQLTILDTNWAGTDAELAAHAMTIAANPAAQTPGALNAKMPKAVRKPAPSRDHTEPKCFICGQVRTECERRQDFEIEHDLPDPHVFETKEQAKANAAPLTPERKAALLHQIPKLFKSVNEELSKP